MRRGTAGELAGIESRGPHSLRCWVPPAIVVDLDPMAGSGPGFGSVAEQSHSAVQCPFVSLVALITRRVLLFGAKHLFVAAIGGSSIIGRQDSRPRESEHLPIAAQ